VYVALSVSVLARAASLIARASGYAEAVTRLQRLISFDATHGVASDAGTGGPLRVLRAVTVQALNPYWLWMRATTAITGNR
jgi:uncharacterized protein involved in copper resistance